MASYAGAGPDTAVLSPVILIGDDDPIVVASLTETLENYGFFVRHVADWFALTECLRLAPYDLLIVEMRLGQVDLVNRFAELHRLTSAPVIFLTHNREENDRILALETGAAGVLLKPISGREIVAHIRAQLRRSASPVRPPEPQQTWRIAGGELRLYAPDGTTVPLTAAEFTLLEYLARDPGQPVSRERLTQEVFGRAYRPEDRSIDSLVYLLRQKVGRFGGGEAIIAVRNHGYAFAGFLPAQAQATASTCPGAEE